MTTAIRPARESDLAFAIDQLNDVGLPTEDLTANTLLYRAECDGELRGVIGLEAFSGAGLLRSLIVSSLARGRGLGEQLVAALETYCVSRGIDEVWLLTIDAAGFFSKLGYVEREREAAPESIRRTKEFSSLCPDDAVLMSRRLQGA